MAETIGLWLYLSTFLVPFIIGFFAPNYKVGAGLGAGYSLGVTLLSAAINWSLIPPEISLDDFVKVFGMSQGELVTSFIFRCVRRAVAGAAFGAFAHFVRRKLRKVNGAEEKEAA